MHHYRYERKYISHDYEAEQLRNFLLLSNCAFKEIYYKRLVNSIYFDTPNLEYLQQNINGDQDRRKIRVRWYGEQAQLENLQLEIKIKYGEIMRKEIYPLEKSILKDGNFLEQITKFVQIKLASQIEEAAALKPVLINSYERQYFYSEREKIRITLDDSMKCQSISDWQKNHQAEHFNFCILECKYNLENDSALSKITQSMPMQISKSSKYVMGMQRLHYAY